MSHTTQRQEEEDDEGKIVPPDGGWGWVVVFASFMIHIVTDGVTYTFGLFYVELLSYFNAGSGATSWIVSILVGVTLCSGPVSSAFVNKYGCRPVTIVGAVLASICMIISIFANSITTLYVTIGLGTGLGFGLIYLPAIVSVTCYFEKYRSLATGIAVCGSGLGTFLFAPIITILLEEYGWKGTMLIIGALILNCVVFGIVFRPLEPIKKTDRLLANDEKVKDENNKKDIQLQTFKINGKETNSNHQLPVIETDSGKTVANGDIQKRPHSIHLFLNSTHSAPPQQNGLLTVPDTKTSDTRMAMSQPHLFSTNASDHYRKHWGSQMLRPTRSGIMYRKDILYRGSVSQLQHMDPNRSYSWMQIDKLHEEKALMEKPAKEVEIVLKESECCGGLPRETMDTLKEMLDFSLLKDPIFILFTVSNFCTSIGFNVPYVYIVAQANERNVENSGMLLAVIGIANTIGRIVLGYISDKPWINRLWVYNSCLTICGIATALSAFCNTFIEFSIYCSVFGFTIGAYVGLTSVILVDLLGLDRLTNAFGLLLLFQGIASLIGPPIAGWLYDILKSYNPGFYVAGVMIALSGLMLYVIPSLQRWLRVRQSKKLRRLNVESPSNKINS